jgi:hypothetical protein
MSDGLGRRRGSEVGAGDAGHESLETTQIYLGLAKKVQRKMVQELAL